MIRYTLWTGILVALSHSGLAIELLSNGAFEQGLKDWEIRITQEYRNAGTEPPAVRIGDDGPEVFATIKNKAAFHYVCIAQPLTLEEGKVYRLALDLKIDGEGEARVALYSFARRRTCGLSARFPAKPEWQRYECLFEASGLPDGEPPKFQVGFSAQQGTMVVRKLSLTLTDKAQVTADERRAAVVKAADKGTEARAAADALPASQKASDLSAMIAAFSENAEAAMARYGHRTFHFSSPLVDLTPGPSSDTWIFTLEYGKAKLLGKKELLWQEDAKALPARMQAAKRAFAQRKQSPAWTELTPADKKRELASLFPLLNGSGQIVGFRDGIVLINKCESLDLPVP